MPRTAAPVAVLDLRPAGARAALITSPPTTIAVRDATVGPLSGTIDVSCGRHLDLVRRRCPSSAATSCGKIVLVPWPISVDAVRTRIRPSPVSSRLATLASLTSPEPGEAGAVPGQREADAARASARPRLPRCVALGGRPAPGRARTRSPRRPAPGPRRGDALAQDLAGRRHAALPVHPAPAELERRHAERVGDAVHLHLGGELGLRRPEAAERAVGRRVGGHRPRRGCARSGTSYGPPAWSVPRDRTTGVSVRRRRRP